MTRPAGCGRPDLSGVVKIPVLCCTASQDIKTKPTTSLRHKGPFISRLGASARCSFAAIHCATRSVHRVT